MFLALGAPSLQRHDVILRASYISESDLAPMLGKSSSIEHWRRTYCRAEFDESFDCSGRKFCKTASTARRYSAFDRKLLQDNGYVCD